ncbi:MAG: hypothetical protein JXR65_05930 [Bacteroidales bacterium]|nr:hypothetical protein [Bacteroidales bacterium]
MNVLFVDLENVCRSPLAVALLRKKYDVNEIHGVIDSAGFESFNINEPPDERVVNIAQKNGYLLSGKARLFTQKDFEKFDRIFVMDTVAYNNVEDLSTNKDQMKKVDFILNLISENKTNSSIPNPYYNGVSDCQNVFNLLDEATDKIIEEFRNNK